MAYPSFVCQSAGWADCQIQEPTAIIYQKEFIYYSMHMHDCKKEVVVLISVCGHLNWYSKDM